MEVEDKVEVIKIDPLPGNEVAPPLLLGEHKEVKEVLECKCGSKHIDVGLASEYNFIRCHECQEELPRGSLIHWCHPSRFKLLADA